jgi:hypothetical protein
LDQAGDLLAYMRDELAIIRSGIGGYGGELTFQNPAFYFRYVNG